MILSFESSQTFLVVVTKKLVQKVDRLVADVSLVLRGHKTCPWFALVSVNTKVALSGVELIMKQKRTFPKYHRIVRQARCHTFRDKRRAHPCQELW